MGIQEEEESFESLRDVLIANRVGCPYVKGKANEAEVSRTRNRRSVNRRGYIRLQQTYIICVCTLQCSIKVYNICLGPVQKRVYNIGSYRKVYEYSRKRLCRETSVVVDPVSLSLTVLSDENSSAILVPITHYRTT